MSGLVIEREILIEAPAEVVWRTITEPDQMSPGHRRSPVNHLPREELNG
jgi:hypothetical protein